ncbi:hypothetical protein [Parafrankia soli]|uniref:hypothetical protein n=1 Tax=Parafrankia soli TaxID=2599596 RepID=UPI0034D5EA73
MLTVAAGVAMLSGCGGSEDSTTTATPTREAAPDDIAGVPGTRAFINGYLDTLPMLRGRVIDWNVGQAGIKVCKAVPNQQVALHELIYTITNANLNGIMFAPNEVQRDDLVALAVQHICPEKA